MTIRNPRLGAGLLVAALGLAGCAPEVLHRPAQLASRAPSRHFVSERPVTAHGSSYDAVIPADTEFDEIGAVREGHVLRPTNKVITVGSGNVHEAYPVADAGRLVGFYLPFERAFAPAEPAIDFPLKERAQR